MKTKILILGLTNKSGMAVARNLHKYGCIVDAILFSDVAAKHSRFIRNAYELGNPELDVHAFTSRLLDHLQNNEYDGMIPIHDGAIEICRYKEAEISRFVKLSGINEDQKYKYSINKSELLEIGKRYGLLVPAGELIDSLESFQRLNPEIFTFPLIAKPIGSAKIVNNRLLSFSVRLCNDLVELTDFIRENINSTEILIQEFIKGYGIGYNFIAIEGIIQHEYVHRRINEHGGVSTLRESLSTKSYGLRDQIQKMIKEIGWNGVGMVEFLINEDGTPILMEFNGRFFGSTELSVKSGINLPVLFLEYFILGKSIRTDQRFKESTLRFLHDEVILFFLLFFKGKFKTFFLWLGNLAISATKRRSYIEDSIFEDFKFVFALYFFDLKRWHKKFRKKRLANKIKILPITKQDLSGILHISFFCLGNICRSPFAQYLAQQTASRFTFSSTGSIGKENRLPPTNAVCVAKQYGVDISLHRSQSLSSTDLEKVDLFVVMDKQNLVELTNAGVASSKIRFLSEHEIQDPYGKKLNEFEKTYSQINSAIRKIFQEP
jgi:protein-tyrosine-phosphatase/predicted ATP-grasp superfamily ATP-dependent carboligase